MQQENAIDFYERVTQGKDYSKTISLEAASGAVLENVQMSPVTKQTLASTMSSMPDEMFDAIDEAEDVEEAEEAVEQSNGLSMNSINDETIEAFEDLCKESLSHDDLAPPQMDEIVEALSFQPLFALGTEIINISVENDGAVRDFHEQD